MRTVCGLLYVQQEQMSQFFSGSKEEIFTARIRLHAKQVGKHGMPSIGHQTCVWEVWSGRQAVYTVDP